MIESKRYKVPPNLPVIRKKVIVTISCIKLYIKRRNETLHLPPKTDISYVILLFFFWSLTK